MGDATKLPEYIQQLIDAIDRLVGLLAPILHPKVGSNIVVSRDYSHGDVAGANPWDWGTLEWASDSPPPNYNFVNLPAATSRYPLWNEPNERVVVTGMRDDRREVLVTTLMDAEPHHRYVLPSSSIWPNSSGTSRFPICCSWPR